MNTPDKFEVINDEAQERNKQKKAESRKNKTCTKQQVCEKCTCKRLDKESIK